MRDVLYCPNCKRRLQLPDDVFGKQVQCPSCQRVFTAAPDMTTGPATTVPATRSAPASSPPRAYEDEPRRSRRDDEFDPDDRRPTRRGVPHRGGEILTFGLLALLPCPLTAIIFGIIAWTMANTDLAEMRTGRMDREGDGLSQAGRALGIVGLFLWCIACVCWGISISG